MTYDISHLYKTKTLNLGKLKVVVQEIPHGKYAQAQDEMLGRIEWDGNQNTVDRSMVEAVKLGKISTGDVNDMTTVAGIQSWTLKDNTTGETLPICIEVYRLLPHFITEQIEKAIESLNPTLEKDFQGES